MSLKTKILGLFKYDPDKDGASTFNIKQALNDNWDKLDNEVAARVKTTELASEVKKTVKGGSLTASDLGAVSAADKGKAGGIAGLGADGKVPAAQLPAMNYEGKGAVDTHNTSTSAHNALFAAKQNKIKGKKGKYVGFTANDTVGEVDAPASGGSRITLTFASDFVGQAWTLSGGSETYTGTVDSSKTATVSVLGINTTYTLSAALSGTTYTAEVTTKAYYTALAVALEKFQSTITVTVDSGSTVTATLGSTVLTKTSTGTAVFTVGKAGTWAIKATKGDQTAEGTVSITASGQSKSLTLSYANVFGVCWDTSNSSTALTRLTPSTDPYGLVTKSVTTEPKPAVGTGAGSSPFDSFMPWSGMKECNLNNAGAVTAWKGDSGFSRSNNFTMVFIPEFYVAAKRSGTKQYFYVSDMPKAGMVKHPGSGKFVARYTGPGSKTGSNPMVNITRAIARSNAKKNGDKWHTFDFATLCAIVLLYIVEFADWNFRGKIGSGRTDANSVANSGATDTLTYHTGCTTAKTNKTGCVQYRWIENLWGNVFQWVDGYNVNNVDCYYCTEPSNYADDTTSGYTKIGTMDDYGWIYSLAVTDDGLMIPLERGGSTSTYIPVYMYSPANKKWHVLLVGGCWDKSTYHDLIYFGAGNESSHSHSSISVRLICEP